MVMRGRYEEQKARSKSERGERADASETSVQKRSKTCTVILPVLVDNAACQSSSEEMKLSRGLSNSRSAEVDCERGLE